MLPKVSSRQIDNIPYDDDLWLHDSAWLRTTGNLAGEQITGWP